MREYYIKSSENKKAFFYPNEWNNFFMLLTQKQQISFRFMIQTGARINELRNIKVKDIDFGRGNIKLRITKCKAIKGEKSPVPRTISISSEFTNYLKTYIRTNKLKREDTFGVMSTNRLNDIIKENAKAINKPEWKDLSCHNIRKTFIACAYALGVEPTNVALHNGHDLKTAMKHYVSSDTFSRDDKLFARRILGDLFIK